MLGETGKRKQTEHSSVMDACELRLGLVIEGESYSSVIRLSIAEYEAETRMGGAP